MPTDMLRPKPQKLMIYLIGSILLTSYLIVAFKVLENLKLGIFQSIVFNYITCTITGSIINGSPAVSTQNIQSDWFIWACLMGTIFIVIYNLVGITTQKLGAAVSAVSYKVSLIIPAIAGVYLYNETLAPLQRVGIVLAMVAVVLTCWPGRQASPQPTSVVITVLLPLIVFLGSGLQDALIKYIEFSYLNNANENAFLSSAFAAAAIIGSIALAVRLARRQQIFNWRNVVAGICIGIPNYFSIWCLIRYLQISKLPSSAIIPINNMGIVLCSALTAWLVFKEYLAAKNIAGILLALAAIFLIGLGGML